MNMEHIKIALLGVSHWHVPLYFAGLPEHSVVAVSDDDAALAARVASRFSCPSYTDERQMIRDAKPESLPALTGRRWKPCITPRSRRARSARFPLSGGTATR